MKDISQKNVNIRLIKSAKEFSYEDGHFNRDEPESSTESYLRTLFYPSLSQSIDLKPIEYDGDRELFYTRKTERLNYFDKSYINDLSNFFSSGNITQSVSDPYGGTNAVSFYAETASANTYSSLNDGSYYVTGWFKSNNSSSHVLIENNTSSIDNNWGFYSMSVNISGSSVDFSSPDGVSVYAPRLYDKDHILYTDSLTSSATYENREHMYHMSSSYQYRPNGINRGSFEMNLNEKYYVTDDGGGNLIHNNDIVGNIFYDHGHIFIDDRYYLSGSSKTMQDFYHSSSYVDYKYTSDVEVLKTTITDLLESDYYNATGNPSYTGSADLYVNKIVLYNDLDEVVMVGNLSKAISVKHDLFFVLEMLEVI